MSRDGETTAPIGVLSFGSVLPAGIDAIARGGIAASQSQLPDPLRKLHQALLREFLAAGRAPTTDRLRTLAAGLGLDAAGAISQLADADLVHLDRAGNRIRVVYPLSAVPSDHRVTLADGPPLDAMCAIDSLGIPLMARTAGTVVSRDPRTRTEIRVSMADAGTWTWQPVTAVVLLAASECSGPIAAACQHTAFYATRESAELALLELPGRTGRVLEQEEAVAIAETEFGPLLT
jgi:alkylmercury lyase